MASSRRRHAEARRAASGTRSESMKAADIVFAWCMRQALRMERAGAFERAAAWAHVAARTAAEFGHAALASEPLEMLLLRLGRRLPAPPRSAPGSGAPRRWLHVFSMTAAIGG